jgi:hypothetical protein
MRFVLTLSLLFASSCLADHVLRNAHAHARHARRAVNSTNESTSDDAIDLAKRGGARFTYFQVGLYVPHLCLRLLRGSLILVARALWQLEVLVGATIRIATMCAFASRGCVAARFSGFVLTLYVVSDRGAELTSTHIFVEAFSQIRIPRTYVSQEWDGGSHCGETITISYNGKSTHAIIRDEVTVVLVCIHLS